MAEIIRLNVADIAAFKKAMAEAGDNIEAQAKVLARFKRDTGKGLPVEVEYTVKNRGKSTIKEIRADQRSLIAGEEDFRKQLAKNTATEQKSLTATRQRLAQAKQVLNSLNQNTDAYERQQRRVDKLNTVLQRRQGIQAGSAAALKSEISDLLAYGNNTALAGKARDLFNQKLLESNESLRRAQGIEKGSIADLKARKNELAQLSSQYAIGSRRQQQYSYEINQINRQLAQTIPTFQRFITSLNQIATIQAGFTAISAFAGQVNGLINQFTGRVKQIENFRLAIQNVGFSLGEANAFFQEATDTALKLGAPVTQIEQAYRRMIPALQGAGISSEDSSKFIENLAARTQVLGLSADQSGRLVEAFAQVLSKGKLQAEELNQQISEVDGAFRTQFAEALGITVEQLSELTKQGNVTSTEFVKGFNSMQNGVDALAAKVSTGNLTIQQLQNTISTINTKALEAIGTAVEPAIRAILRITLAVQKFAVTIAQSRFGQLIATSFNEALLGVEAFIKTVFSAIAVLGQILTPFANLLLLLQQNVFGLGTITRALVYFAGVLITVRLGVTLLTKSLALTAALAGGQFVSSWGAAGAALLGFGSIAKSILTLNFVGFGLKIKQTLGLLVSSFTTAGVAGKQFQGTLAALTRAAAASGGSFTVFATKFSRLQNAIGKGAAGSKVTSSNWRELGTSAQVASAATNGLAEGLVEAGVQLGVTALTGGKAAKITGDVAGSAVKASRGVSGLGKVLQSISGLFAKVAAAGNIAKGFAKLTLAITAAIVVLEVLVNTFRAYSDANNLIGKKNEELNARLKEQGFIVKQTNGFWATLGNTFKKTFVELGGLIPYLNGLAINSAFEGQVKNTEKVIRNVNKTLIESGLKFDETGAKITFFADRASKASTAITTTRDSLNEQIGAMDGYIQKLEAERGENDGTVKSLKEKRERLKEQAALYSILARRVDISNATVEDATNADGKFSEQLQATNKWLDQRRKKLEEQKGQRAIQFQSQYIKGLITEGELNRRLAEDEAIFTMSRLKDEMATLKVLEDRGKQKLSIIDKNKLEEALENKIKTVQELKNKLSEQAIALKEANLKQLDEEAQKVSGIAGIYDTVRDQSVNISGQIGSTITNAISAIQEGITKSAALEFSVSFDEGALRRASNVRQRLGALEFKLQAVRIQTERIIQISSLRRVAAEQRLLAAKLRSEGDAKGALLAEQSANAIERQIPALNAAFDVQARIAGLQERGYKAEVNRKREILGLPALFANNIQPVVGEYENLEGVVNSLSNSYVESSQIAQAAAQNGADYYVAATKVITNSADQRAQKQQQVNDAIIKALDSSVSKIEDIIKRLDNSVIKPSLDTSELEKGKEEVIGVEEAITKSGEFLKRSFEPQLFKDIRTGIEIFTAPDPWSKFISKVKEAASALDFLFKPRKSPTLNLGNPNSAPARWMGGPVASGQTYTVNDGGGREGFLDKFSNFKMLPAGRNIKWTPTTSGTVIPSHLVDQFKQSMASAQINSTNKSASINPSVSRVNASLDSGNLVKQIGSMMAGSGTNQRITNNVTIQSQSPVMDASRIMANVNRLRNRRRGLL